MTNDLVAPRTVLKFRIKTFLDKMKPKKSTAKMTDSQLVNYCKKHNISIGRKGGAPKGYKWSKVYSRSMRIDKSKSKDNDNDKLKNLKKARKVKNAKQLKMDEPKSLPKMVEKKEESDDDDD